MTLLPLDEVKAIVERQYSSNLSPKEFCEKEGIPLWKIYHYRQRVRKAEIRLCAQEKVSPAFIELSKTKSGAQLLSKSSSGLSISCENLMLHVETDFDSDSLKSLLRALIDVTR
jgi:hypothetical protein